MVYVNLDRIILPDYELEPSSHNCPWCNGTMEIATINNAPYIGPYGRYHLDRVRVYRCRKCSWERVPTTTFDIVEALLKKKLRQIHCYKE